MRLRPKFTHLVVNIVSVGLVTSALMVIGIAGISPLFITIKQAEEKQRNLAVSLQDALAKIKTLNEVLPICASCKKIRDDQGYSPSLKQRSPACLKTRRITGYMAGNTHWPYRSKLPLHRSPMRGSGFVCLHMGIGGKRLLIRVC